MRKKITTVALTTLMALAISVPTFAAQWQSDANGWWYQNDDGGYPISTWQWIDGNGDGTAESYYFNEQGYCLMNTTTPDGYLVNPSGAWIVGGVVQTQQLTTPPVANNVQAKYLKDMEPVTKSAYSIEESWRTNQNALWTNVVRLSGALNDTYVEYYTGAEFNTLTAKIAPAQNFDPAVEYSLEVYGDNDTLLDVFAFDYKTTPIDISINIGGQNYVKLVWVQTKGVWSSGMLLKDAKFN